MLSEKKLKHLKDGDLIVLIEKPLDILVELTASTPKVLHFQVKRKGSVAALKKQVNISVLCVTS